jgi:catechol 2,3-dioxygenase-like lactoylglutathione lyase family enzyme
VALIRHIEIARTNGERVRRFREDLFGWKIVRREIAGFDDYDVETGGDPEFALTVDPEGSPIGMAQAPSGEERSRLGPGSVHSSGTYDSTSSGYLAKPKSFHTSRAKTSGR